MHNRECILYYINIDVRFVFLVGKHFLKPINFKVNDPGIKLYICVCVYLYIKFNVEI